jgi:pimeloyl-ACP methyl ester carboxylesterase
MRRSVKKITCFTISEKSGRESLQVVKPFVVANCGHVVNVEQPIVFNDAVLSFMK